MKRSSLAAFIFLLSAFSGRTVSAENRTVNSFGSCTSADEVRGPNDNFCPRVEGVHLEGCCPPVEKRPGVKCTYVQVDSAGQPYMYRSSKYVCNPATKKNVSIPCCRLGQGACYRNPITLDFIARLLKRNKSCCFELCPTADYWLTPPVPPQASSLTKTHILVSGGLTACGPIQYRDACTPSSALCDDGEDLSCPVDVTPVPPVVPLPPGPADPGPIHPIPAPPPPPPDPGDGGET